MSPQLAQRLKELSGSRDELMARRMEAIEKAIMPDFMARPENSMGRLPPVAVRPIARAYFAKEHGWVMKGLEPAGMMPNGYLLELHQVPALRHGDPKLAELLRQWWMAGHGLNLADVAGVVAALEWLTLEKSVHLLDAAYALNGLSSSETLSRQVLGKVLQSYLLLFRQGRKANFLDSHQHQAMKKKAALSPSWRDLVDFESAALQNFTARSAAGGLGEARHFTRRMAEEVVLELALGYGKWQNKECQAMKADLIDLDAAASTSGSVPFAEFHAFPPSARYGYRFTESIDYLRRIEALEETSSAPPRVLVANYLVGPTNCIAATAHTAVCCINECEAPLDALERHVRAPDARPAELLSLVSGGAWPHGGTPLRLPADMGARLESLAKENSGLVQLRGAGFARWLHDVLPNECPRPIVAGYEAEEQAVQHTIAGASGGHSDDRSPLHHLLKDEACTRVPEYMVTV